jgi:hypothetical protein
VNAERERLANAAPWRNWGPYLADRAWGTVREDYSADADPWRWFPHDHARSRAYRWGEDGIAGFCDRYQILCWAMAFWNERDPILKERFFGLVPTEGNHGEDVKECWFYVDALPSHAYQRMLCRIRSAFPHEQLIEENRRRSTNDPELELIDPHLRRRPLLRHRDRDREATRGDARLPRHRAQSRSRARAAASHPEFVVPQHVVVDTPGDRAGHPRREQRAHRGRLARAAAVRP